ncbi:MAG TPA: hypothetical protein VFL94_09915 [Actinomycetales bacterium]|nr:hypothetical protein [Actinomycetales bacterium]
MLMRRDGGGVAPTLGTGVLPTAAAPGPARQDVLGQPIDEQLLDLICADPELLAAEFDSIVAAEWPIPPVTHLRHAAAAGPPDRTLGRLCLDVGALAFRPHHPGIGGWARERSPPRRAGVSVQRRGRDSPEGRWSSHENSPHTPEVTLVPPAPVILSVRRTLRDACA